MHPSNGMVMCHGSTRVDKSLRRFVYDLPQYLEFAANRIYAAAEGSPSKLWRSNNAGNTWVETFDTVVEPNWLGAQGWYDNTIVCHPTDQDIVYVGGVRLWELEMVGATSRTITVALLAALSRSSSRTVTVTSKMPSS